MTSISLNLFRNAGEEIVNSISNSSHLARLVQEASSSIFSALNTNPYLALGTVGVGAAAAAFFVYKGKVQTSPEYISRFISTEITKAFQEIKKNRDSEAKEIIKRMVFKILEIKEKNGELGSHIKNEKYFQFLANKILDLVYVGNQSDLETVIEISKNITNLLTEETKKLKKRVEIDCKNGNLEPLGIYSKDQIKTIYPIGNETHNQGKVVWLVTFDSGISIVYKPRSILAEKLICDRENSVLNSEKFGTYGILSFSDNGEDYGYVEFLRNEKQDNTITEKKQLHEYITKVIKLEKIAEELGISDLHYENIITTDLNPQMIDLEVFSNPPGIPSGLFDSNGPLHTYANPYKKPGNNQIWIQIPEFRNILTKDIEYNSSRKISIDNWNKMGFDFDQMKTNVSLTPETLSYIETVKQRLRNENGRIVFVSTHELRDIFKHVTNPEKAKKIFWELLEQNFETSSILEPIEEFEAKKQEVLELFEVDFMNNDYPIFLYREGNLYYSSGNKAILIGKQREKPLETVSYSSSSKESEWRSESSNTTSSL